MDINLTLVIQGLAFFAVAWVVMKFGWPHIMGAIVDRQKKIAEGLTAAERAHAELREADSKVEAEIKVARQKSAEIIDRAQQQANQILDKARADTVIETNRLKAAAQDEIASMAQRAREELRARVGALAVQGASKIVQREIDPAAHKALLDQLATEI
ncbi:MAG: F0F1 ATP synthase subunit B [Rhodanobacter sp.]